LVRWAARARSAGKMTEWMTVRDRLPALCWCLGREEERRRSRGTSNADGVCLEYHVYYFSRTFTKLSFSPWYGYYVPRTIVLLSGSQKGIEVEGARRDAESSDVGTLGHGSGRLPACPLLPGVCAGCGIFCPYTCMLMSVISVLLRQEPATWGGLDLGSAGVWVGDYGWGVRVRRPFGARGRSSVRYGTRLGDLKEN
jgi:hypothetical protein